MTIPKLVLNDIQSGFREKDNGPIPSQWPGLKAQAAPDLPRGKALCTSPRSGAALSRFLAQKLNTWKFTSQDQTPPITFKVIYSAIDLKEVVVSKVYPSARVGKLTIHLIEAN